MEKIFVSLCALLSLWAFSPARGVAQNEPGDQKTLSPYFFVKSEASEVEQLPLKSTEANVHISGVIANVQVRQTYVNNGKKPLEAIYVFPASTRAAVYSMKMIIGERVLKAVIQEKNKARKIYEKAKKEGKSASLLEQERPNVFTMNVANIMPGDTIHVDLRYTELLVPENGIYELVYPTVVGPRYAGETQGAEATANAGWVENPYTREGEAPTYSFELNATISAGIPIHDIRSQTHKIDVQFDSKTQATCRLDASESTGGNRDFIVQYRLTGKKIQSGLLLFEGDQENFFLAMLQPPQRPTPANIPPREYVFVVDVSGSMHGFPISVSKTLMKNLLSNLATTDVFNVMLFAGGSQVLSEKSIPATADNIEKATRFVEKQQAGGATNLLSALKNAFALKGTQDFSRSFVVITDGYVSVERETFDLIRQKLNNANVFAFGIGSSVNRYIIEGISRAGMGKDFVATNSGEAQTKATLFRKYIQTPVLTNIEFETPGFDAYDIQPQALPDVFSERPVLLFGKWKGKPQGEIKITGSRGKQPYQASLKVKKTQNATQNLALKYLWARHKIQMLDDYAQTSQSPAEKEEITRLGLQYNLLTRYTSFVAVDSLARNDSSVVTVNQPLPLPKGVSNKALSALAPTGTVIMSDEIEVLDIEEEVEEETEIFLVAEQMPEFPGGEMAMKKYIAQNTEYPEEAKEAGIYGKVYVRFCIEPDGSISNIQVVRGIDPLLDKAAIEVIKKMAKEKKWKPGKIRGKPVKSWFTVPIDFSLK